MKKIKQLMSRVWSFSDEVDVVALVSQEPQDLQEEINPPKSYLSLMKQIGVVAAPIFVSQLVLSSRIPIESKFAALLSKETASSFALIESYQTLYIVIVNVAFNPVRMFVGQAYGEKDAEKIGNVLRQSFLYAIPWIGATTLTLCFVGSFNQLVGESVTVSHIAQQYFNGMAINFWANILLMAWREAFNGLGKTYLTMFLSGGETVMRVLIMYPLTFGFNLGEVKVPALNAFGMGLSGLTNILFLLPTIMYMTLSPSWRPFKIFSRIKREDFYLMKEIFVNGGYMAMVTAFDFVNTAVINWASGTDKNDPRLIPTGLANQLALWQLMFLYGLTDTIGSLVSQYFGAKEHHNILRVWKSCLALGGTLGSIFFLMSSIFGREIFAFFNPTVTEEKWINLFQIMLSGNTFVNLIDIFRIISIVGLFCVDDAKAANRINALWMGLFSLPTMFTVYTIFSLAGYNFDHLPEALLAVRALAILGSAVTANRRFSHVVDEYIKEKRFPTRMSTRHFHHRGGCTVFARKILGPTPVEKQQQQDLELAL